MRAKRLKKDPALFYILALSLFLELVFMYYFGIFSIRPDVFLVLVVFLSIYSSRNMSLYIPIALGILRDILSISPLGVYILGFLLCRFIIERLKKKIYPGRIAIDICLVFISTLAVYLYLSLIMRFQNSFLLFRKIPLGLILGSTVYTTIISIPLFLVFNKIKASKELK